MMRRYALFVGTLLTGLSISCLAMIQMTHFDLSMGTMPFILSGVIQGLGVGLLFVPLSTLAFATIPAHLRPEGSSLYTLIRNMGSAVGISIMQALVVANTQTVHSTLAAQVIPADPVVQADLARRFDLASPAGLAGLNGEITRQATMVAYVLTRYRGAMGEYPRVRRAVIAFSVAALLAAGIAGSFGAMIDKAAPVEGGGTVRVMGGAR